jgi:hypothetical protein
MTNIFVHDNVNHFKWDGDLNDIKIKVKEAIETVASSWTIAERQQCIDATKAAFQGGGAINSHLSGALVNK